MNRQLLLKNQTNERHLLIWVSLIKQFLLINTILCYFIQLLSWYLICLVIAKSCFTTDNLNGQCLPISDCPTFSNDIRVDNGRHLQSNAADSQHPICEYDSLNTLVRKWTWSSSSNRWIKKNISSEMIVFPFGRYAVKHHRQSLQHAMFNHIHLMEMLILTDSFLEA